jgi:ribonuclease T1
MKIPPRIVRTGALCALVSSLVVGGPALASATQAPASPATLAAVPSTAQVGDICYSDLPPEAHDTLDLIQAGGPYPYPQDGTVFQNREGQLPAHEGSYYHEYTVKTPGSPDRGARRIVTGEAPEEDYYTADHYASFDLIDASC